MGTWTNMKLGTIGHNLVVHKPIGANIANVSKEHLSDAGANVVEL